MTNQLKMQGRSQPKLVDESVVAAVARIMGAHSAAQQALNDAAARREAGKAVVIATMPGSFLVIDAASLA